MLQGFKNFIMRGNVMELAVAVVIGAAFTTVVNSIVDNVINPLVSRVAGQVELADAWVVPLGGEPWLRLGAVVGAVINFLLVAATVYFVVVLPVNRLSARRKEGVEPEPQAPAEDVLLLQEIRDLLAARRDA